MTRPLPILLLVLLLGSPATLVHADEEGAPEAIEWHGVLAEAFAEAKATQKPLMIAVNAGAVPGEPAEPAALGLRTVVYKDSQVIARAQSFVCALLTRTGSSADFGELRALGIEGMIVSPQHIFVHPDGEKILHRKQYWPHGSGASGVKAMLDMMLVALQAMGVEAPEAPADPDAVPGAGEASRAEWIAEQLERVVAGTDDQRPAAVASLIEADEEGDCITPLVGLLETHKKDEALLAELIRLFGRDKFEAAALLISEHLLNRDDRVRAMAAVSLEYIGSAEKKVISTLKQLATREKDPSIANHAFRALGRCGAAAADSKIRALLIKEAGSASSEFASFGPLIGLTYFEGDEKAARGVERLLKKLGVPGSRRGGGTNAVKRALASWTLAYLGSGESAEFVQEKLIDGLENIQAFWVDGLRGFWQLVARVCAGERELLPAVEEGVRGTVTFVKTIELERYGAESRNLMDEFRLDRAFGGFTPRGDHIMNDEREG